MSSSSSARQFGDEVHQYLFWLWAARMLAGRDVLEVGYETGDFRAFDDVGVRYASPRPDGLGGFFDEDHVQAKFSVAGGKVLTGESLANPALINATNVSLLERLRDAVDKAESEKRRCRFVLYSPWPIEPDSLLDRMVDKAQGALRLELLFKGKTDRSESMRLRKCWAENLKVDINDESGLRRVLRPFRIEYESKTLEWIRAEFTDKMPAAGLRPISGGCRVDRYPGLIQSLHREGRRWFSSEHLIEACTHEGLWAGRPKDLVPVKRLGIRTFRRFAEGLEDETDSLVCLTEFFTDRRIRHAGLWKAEVLPQLVDFLGKHLKPGDRFQLHLPAVASVAFAAGYLAEPKLGASFEVSQRGISGTNIWRCGMTDEDSGQLWAEEIIGLGRAGDELAVAISVTQPVLKDVKVFVEQRLPAVSRVLHLKLLGVGQDAVKGGGHAFRATRQAVDEICRQKATLGTTGRIHLFWASPNGLTFMLGQLARPLGPIALYEFDFEGVAEGRYLPSLSLDPSVRLA